MRGELFSPQQIEVLDRLFDRQPPCPIQSNSDLYASPDSGKVRAWHHAGTGLRLSSFFYAQSSRLCAEKHDDHIGQNNYIIIFFFYHLVPCSLLVRFTCFDSPLCCHNTINHANKLCIFAVLLHLSSFFAFQKAISHACFNNSEDTDEFYFIKILFNFIQENI